MFGKIKFTDIFIVGKDNVSFVVLAHVYYNRTNLSEIFSESYNIKYF